jgi:hypothetical protein
MVMALNIFFYDATFICYNINRMFENFFMSFPYQLSWVAQGIDPSFFNSIALLISPPHPQLASILKTASVCFLSSVTIAIFCT